MSNVIVWEPGEAVRVEFSWSTWADGDSLTAVGFEAHPDITISEQASNGYLATALFTLPTNQAVGSELWIRFTAEAGSRKGARTQHLRVGYLPPSRR